MLTLFAPNRLNRSLAAKVAAFFAILFALTSAISVYGAQIAVERFAEHMVAGEMSTASAVFDRLTRLEIEQLEQGGQVLAGDFGFRAAAATRDEPTIKSALESLRTRYHLTDAFLVTLDGQILGASRPLPAGDRARIFASLDRGDRRGLAIWQQSAQFVAASPVRAPNLLGWVVFTRKMGAPELATLTRFTTLKLTASIVPRDGVAPSSLASTQYDGRRAGSDDLFLRVTPVPNFGGGPPQALLLQYGRTTALAAYRPVLLALMLLGILGTMLAIVGSIFLARRLTRPIIALEGAARAVGLGERAQVAVTTRDEIGALADSFNLMVDGIEERERRIAHMAFHDELTGLANRALLREHVAQTIKGAVSEQKYALLCVDLDNFKAVNDTLGHPTGDALLKAVAEGLESLCIEGLVARLGGDEFAIFMPGDERQASALARAIVARAGEPYILGDQRLLSGASVGIAIAPLDGTDPTELLKNADLALYRAKGDGRSCFRFFETGMDAEAQRRRALEVELRDAITRREFELYFQPLFGLDENKVTAFEALLRWNHPERGQIPPLDFIPLAEETGLIIQIGEWVIREACRIASAWPDQIKVAVNVSPVQFRSPSLSTIIIQALGASNLAPNRLELEITESLFIEDVESTLASLHKLRSLGVRVALDDFGTGYSSLSYLRSFPFDKLKIDRTFIEDLLSRDGATAIIHSITSLAKALGMETTAEGVECKEQLEILRDQGCSQIQGFYFSRPVTAAEVDGMIGTDIIRQVA